MKASDIENVILEHLAKRSFGIYLTRYEGGGFNEADVLGVNTSQYTYEYEIKTSRSDFKAEFKKKHKHEMLAQKDSLYILDEWDKGKRTGGKYEVITIPNRFYFACKHDLIMPSEVPEYAGLVYVDSLGIKEVKKAPLLHRNKCNTRMYKRMATILSERLMWGCSYATHQIKESNKRFNL